MVRKMVTGDAKNITVNIKREPTQVKCQGCGKEMTVMMPYTGDILCDECMDPKSYSVKID